MVANRIESNSGDLEKHDKLAGAKSEDPAAAVKPVPAWQAWLPLLVSLLLMPVLAYATTCFLLVPKIQQSLGVTEPGGRAPAAAANPGKARSEPPGSQVKRESVSMNKLLVNVSGTMGSRYLLSSLNVVGTAADFKAKVEKYDAQLRDLACGMLSTKTITDLEKPGARNLIRSELITGFNNILGDATVAEIFFTEFAIQ